VTGWEWSLRTRQARRIAVAALLASATLLPNSLTAQQMSPAQVAALKSQVQATGGRVIVQVKPNQGPRLQSNGRSAMSEQALATVQSRLQQRGLRNAWRVNLVPLVFGEVEATDRDLEALLAHPNVVSVEADVDMPLAERRASSFGEVALASLNQSTPWGIDRVTAPAAWALRNPALDGQGIKVAYMDSGGDINHPDLQFAGGYDATSGSTSASAWHDDLSVCNGHGTHVAGTIGALNNGAGIVGVAPGASLYPIKVFRNSNGSCLASVSHQIGGLNWAVSQGVRVVSISIGGTNYVSSYEQAINAAAAAGTFVVAAAGNNGTSTVTYPGRYANALAIGGTDTENNKPSWSNYGPDLFAVAPGTSIYSTMPGGGYGYKSGTSMATPHAAGVVALVLAADPGATRSQVLSQLQQGALDLGGAGRDDQYGHGLTRAFESISGGGTPPPPPPAEPVPLTLSVSPGSRRVETDAGTTTSFSTSATVTLSGDGSGSAAWTASKRKPWTNLTTASGTGSGTVAWSRSGAGLVAGTYVDTITVAVNGLSARIIDSLVVNPVALKLSVTPKSRKAQGKAGTAEMIADSGDVVLTGTGSSTAAWTASRRSAWLSLLTAAGTGSGKLRWTRNTDGLVAGTYVDTITVMSAGALESPTAIIDTLVITAAPGNGNNGNGGGNTKSNQGGGKKTSVSNSTTQAVEIVFDSIDVYLDQENAPIFTWSATSDVPWLSLLRSSGSGEQAVSWRRDTKDLAGGLHIGQITMRLQVEGTEYTLAFADTVITGVEDPEVRDAGEALFAPSTMTDPQRRLLDQLGNRNGLYDIGDFLAWVERTGTAPGASIMDRAMQLRPAGPPAGSQRPDQMDE
jgi:subtilisin